MHQLGDQAMSVFICEISKERSKSLDYFHAQSSKKIAEMLSTKHIDRKEFYTESLIDGEYHSEALENSISALSYWEDSLNIDLKPYIQYSKLQTSLVKHNEQDMFEAIFCTEQKLQYVLIF